MPLAALVVVGIVGGRDLDGAGAEVPLHKVVRHDDELPVHERVDDLLSVANEGKRKRQLAKERRDFFFLARPATKHAQQSN